MIGNGKTEYTTQQNVHTNMTSVPVAIPVNVADSSNISSAVPAYPADVSPSQQTAQQGPVYSIPVQSISVQVPQSTTNQSAQRQTIQSQYQQQQYYSSDPVGQSGFTPGGERMIRTSDAVFFGRHPVKTVCPFCHRNQTTKVYKSIGAISVLLSVGLCVVGCFPFFWIPFCIDGLQSVEHRCSNCNRRLSVRHR